MQNVDNETSAVLNTFDLSVPGHTLIMPKNVGKDYRDKKFRNFNLTTIFNIDPATVPPEVATEVWAMIVTVAFLRSSFSACIVCVVI